MPNALKSGIVLTLGLATLCGCGDDDNGEHGGNGSACDVTPPNSWSAPDWDAHTVEALALRAQLDTLTGAANMRGAEEDMVTIDDVADLDALMAAGDPSLDDVASPGFAPVVDDAFSEFVELLAVGPADLVDNDAGAFTPGAEGGIFGTDRRGINEGGLEVRQLVDKGLFAGGGHFHHAAGLTTGSLDVATLDAIAAIWGGNATMDATMLADSANYAHAMGYFEEGLNALIAARAYAADAGCTAERDASLRTFFGVWEESMFARFVYYANAAATIVQGGTTDDDIASALHELSEGLGLVGGFHGLTVPTAGPLSAWQRAARDADVEGVTKAMGVDLEDLGASTTGTIVVDPAMLQAAVTMAEGVLMTAFGLSASELAAWRTESAPE